MPLRHAAVQKPFLACRLCRCLGRGIDIGPLDGAGTRTPRRRLFGFIRLDLHRLGLIHLGCIACTFDRLVPVHKGMLCPGVLLLGVRVDACRGLG
eukprot:3407116-Pleurochrysis_carterae.AAC.3